MHLDTDSRPPPYYPGKAGQFIMLDEDQVGGLIMGRIKVTVIEDEEDAGEELDDRKNDARALTFQSHKSERASWKATREK